MTISGNMKNLSVILAEDAWQGDANAVIRVDGNEVFNGVVVPGADGTMQVDLGSYSSTDDHQITVEFNNDAWGGTAQTDRNLFMRDLMVDGVSTGYNASLYSNGTADFTVSAVPATSFTDMGGTGKDSISLFMSEDEYEGNAQFTVSLDGVQIGGVQTVLASHSAGMSREFRFLTDTGNSSGQLAVTFINDAWGGTSDTDRNLYVDDVKVNGASVTDPVALYSNGVAGFTIEQAVVAPSPGGAVDLGGTGNDRITLMISEDAWRGDAEFIVTVDGVQIGDVQSASTLHSSGNAQEFSFNTTLGTANHDIGINFINDAWGGTSDTDRNLYVNDIQINGASSGIAGILWSSGLQTFSVSSPGPVISGTGSQTLSVKLSEDAWQGDARFTITVDGKTVADNLEVSARHDGGQPKEFIFKGDFGTGEHQVAVSFNNDAWGGTSDTDRNLYVDSVSMDGVELPNSQQALYSDSTAVFTGSFAVPVVPVTPIVPPVPPAPAAPVFGATGDVGLLAEVAPPDYPAGSNVLTVGTGKEFSTISAAVNASHNGDVILVDAGTYTNDFTVNYSNITLIAVGGRVIMNATVPPPNFKGIITQEADLKVVGFTFTGAHIPDEYGHNAAGIRVDSGNLVLINDEFTNNQDGILMGSGNYTISIDRSLFNNNGGNDGNGAGNIHNIYINDITSATVTNSIFENAQVGHEFKSRAASNYLNNNVFISGVGEGTGSYDIDIPNGGKAVLTNNTIIKGDNAENYNMVHFGGEGIPYPGSSLTVTGNLFSTSLASGAGILNATAISAVVSDNEIVGMDQSRFVSGPAKITSTYDSTGQILPDVTLTGILPGSTTVYTDNLAHTIDVGGSTQAVEGGAGRVTATVSGAHVIVIGGSGGLDLTETNPATGGNQYTTAANSVNSITMAGVGGNSVDSEGTDTIITGSGNMTGLLNGNSTVIQGTGVTQWGVNGTSDITTAEGSTFVSLGVSANLTLRGNDDFYKVDSNGGNLIMHTVNAGVDIEGTVTGGSWSIQTYNGFIHMNTAGGSVGADINLVSGNLSLMSLGADIIHTGSGDATVIISGAAQVYAGTGNVSVFGRGSPGGADFYGAGGDYILDGDTGNITYHGGDTDSTLEARVANITILGGKGHLTVNGGGRSTLIGGSGGLTWEDPNGGACTVTTAAGSVNSLHLSADDVVNSYGTDKIVYDGGNGLINLYGNNTVQMGDGAATVNVYGTTNLTMIGSRDLHLFAGSQSVINLQSMAFMHSDGAKASVNFTDGSITGSPTVSFTAEGIFSVSTWQGGTVSVNDDSGNAPMKITSSTGDININSAGADTITLGSGNSSVNVSGQNADIQAGAGNAMVHGGDNSIFTLYGDAGKIASDTSGSSTMQFIGGTGSATLSGGHLLITGGNGDITASAGSSMGFVGGAGNASLSLGNSGNNIEFGSGYTVADESPYGTGNTFLFDKISGGQDVVNGFRAGTDKLFTGNGVSVVSSDMSSGSYHAIFSNGADLTLTGVTDNRNLFG